MSMNVTHLPHVLFAWWRGDCGQLPEGEETPTEEKRAHALAVIRTHTEEELLPMLRFMARRRWFQSAGVDAGEFAAWLEDLRNSREEDPMADNLTTFTLEESAALLAAAAVILTAPDPHPMAVKQFPILEAAGRKLAGMMGADWEEVKRITAEGPR